MDDALDALGHATAALIGALKVVEDVRQQLLTRERSNVKPAPFYFTEGVTAAVLAGRQGPRMTAVPIESVKLVDRPRPSADPALAKANDDGFLNAAGAKRAARKAKSARGKRTAAPQRRIGAPPKSIDAELWAMFRSDYLRPQAPGVVSCYERCRMIAAERGIAIPSIQTFRRRLIAEGLQGRLSRGVPANETSLAPSTSTVSAPRTEEALPAARVDSRSGPAEGSEAHQASVAGEPLLKHVSVEPMRAAESVPVEPDQLDWPDAPLPGETGAADDDDDDDIAEDFAAALARVRARKAGIAQPAAAKVDWGRVAKARRAAPRTEPAGGRKATPKPALSREECSRCGIPGWKGCEHQLPYESTQP